MTQKCWLWYFQYHLEFLIALFSDEQERGIVVSVCADHFAGYGKCDTNRCDEKYYATKVMPKCCGVCKGISILLYRFVKEHFLSDFSDI